LFNKGRCHDAINERNIFGVKYQDISLQSNMVYIYDYSNQRNMAKGIKVGWPPLNSGFIRL